ncbi:TetR/AcrR family transcriptional regulator [Ancylomarina longa]|uniref:TetR/AcrR family transcriptional regulator n=1 Tax=Ancylomarina longa TaxID=2487017 RepID=A0A434AU52_9BACT|nr:TetR/AcrR family transcriptional regulator [Ancylomarina longa]RUT77958.1 TetR/AcrR family transcriptional regulator [Ancylomarina longa]
MSKINKTEIQDRIKKIALDMILKYGLRGLNMIDLASECGLAKGTLYKIISSKEDLIYQIASNIYDANTTSLLEPFTLFEDPLEATNKFLERYLNYGVESQRSLTIQIYKEYPSIERKLEEDFKDKSEKINSVFLKWQEKGLLRQDIDVVDCVEAMTALNDFYIKSDYSTEEIIKRLRSGFRCILIGMGISI